MDNELTHIKQEIIELAEQFCGGYIKDHKHALEKLHSQLVSHNLSMYNHFPKRATSRPGTSKLRSSNSISDATVDELLAELKKSRQVILSQHERIAQIPLLEAELKEADKKLKMELSKLTNKFQGELTQSCKELKQHNKTVAKNSQLEEKVKLLTMEIESFRRQFHKEIDSDGRTAQLQELSASRSKEIQKLEIACNRLKVQLAMKTQEVEKLNTKTSVMAEELVELKKSKSKLEAETLAKPESSSMVKFYKKKLEEKDSELKKVCKRLSKMNRVEVQCRLKEQGFECERKEYIDRIAELCKSNKELEKIVQHKAGKVQVKEEPKRFESTLQANYENMLELAKSASDAYTSLAAKDKHTGRSTRPTTAGNESKWSTRLGSSGRLNFFT